MAAPMFIFGGKTGVSSPKELKRLREIAEALNGPQRAPQNVGEGLNAIGQALLYRSTEGKAERMEKEGQASAASAFDPIVQALGGVAPSAGPSGSSKVAAALSGMPEAAGELAATAPDADVSKNGSTFTPFIETVKSNGLTNPYGLAAVAATGRAESKWSPQNAARSWSDPSESGQAGTAGGVLSWRADRLANLQRYAASKGEGGNGSPETQAEFFMREDPQLVARLNAAKSPEEASQMMAGAWKFAGHDRPGGEAGRRAGYANAYLPQFQGGAEVASLDPAAGMTSAAGAINAVAPPSGSVAPAPNAPQFDAGRFGDPMKLSEMPPAQGDMASRLQSQASAYVQQSQGQPQQPQMQPQQPGGALPPLPVREIGPTPQVASPPQDQVAQSPQRAPMEVAQAQTGPSMQQLYQALQNPWLNEGQQQMVMAEIQRQQQNQDPDTLMKRKYMQAQTDALMAKPTKQWQRLDDNTLFNPETGETRGVPVNPNAPAGTFRFGGKSVEAQSLNGLIDSGQLTPDQAQQLGAGKTISGPNGEIIFMTPQGVFGKAAGQAPQPMSGAPQQPSQGVDIFAGSPMGSQQAQEPTSVPGTRPVQQPNSNGMLTLTEPKVTIDEKKAMTFADRMRASGALIDKHGTEGAGMVDSIASQVPYLGNYLVSDEYQSVDQARRDFINAQLRRESGAVIGKDEFDNANRQYFPQPGDNPETVKQKAANRKLAVEGMIRDSGPTYQTAPAPAAGRQMEVPDFSKMSDEEIEALINGN